MENRFVRIDVTVVLLEGKTLISWHHVKKIENLLQA